MAPKEIFQEDRSDGEDVGGKWDGIGGQGGGEEDLKQLGLLDDDGGLEERGKGCKKGRPEGWEMGKRERNS
jgi:predicted transcriptional regulator with HTH domain